MKSELFRRIANRADFVNTWLQSTIPYTPHTFSKYAKGVRTVLRLNDSSTDYFVTSLASALAGTPALIQEFLPEFLNPFSLRGYTAKIFTPPQGVKLVAGELGLPRVDRIIDTWPVERIITLQYLDPIHARISAGTVTEVIEARMNNQYLQVAWPAWSGITGWLELSNGTLWETGSIWDFTVEPSNFPFAAAIARLQLGRDWLGLIEDHGLAAPYAGASNEPLERIALVALALVRDTLRE